MNLYCEDLSAACGIGQKLPLTWIKNNSTIVLEHHVEGRGEGILGPIKKHQPKN